MIIRNLDDTMCSPKEYSRAADTLELIALYMRLKGRAKSARIAGKINDALAHESSCDELYQSLPVWARW